METTKSPSATKISLIILAIAAVIALVILAPKNQKIAAKVNDQKITIAEFDKKVSQTVQIIKSFSGETELPEEQISKIKEDSLNALITVVLVAEYAEGNNISVSEEELKQEYDLIVSSSGGEDQLKEQLKQFGISQTQFLADIKNDLTQKKSVENYMDPALLEIKGEEIIQTYNTLLNEAKENGSEEQIPPYEDVKDYLALQMKNQRILENSEVFIGNLKGQATIEIFI